ncbi:hypothetical protein GGF32_001021 [Allomyces javanicus]|nr:hypothetical protein GGF32_001021 [Allomyces javanicus]
MSCSSTNPLPGPIVTFSNGTVATWSGVTFADFEATNAAVLAANRWSIFAAENSAVLTIDACNVVGSGSKQALFRVEARGAGSLTLQGSAFSSTAVDLSATDTAQLTLRTSHMRQVWAQTARGIINTAGGARIDIASAEFTGWTDTLLQASGTSHIEMRESTVTNVRCTFTSQFGLAWVTEYATILAALTKFINLDSSTCAGGLIGVDDITSFSTLLTDFKNCTGRLVTGGGIGQANFWWSSFTNVNESPDVQWLGLFAADSRSLFHACTINGMVGSWSFSDNTLFEFSGGTTATNVVCPANKPYVLAMAGTMTFTMSESTFTSNDRSTACALVQLTEASSLTATDVAIDGYLCKDACLQISGVDATATLTRVNLTNIVLAEGGMGVVYCSGDRASLTILSMLATRNIGNSVVAASGLGNGATITNATFLNNQGSGLRLTGRATMTVADSTFSGNRAATAAGGGAIWTAGGDCMLKVSGSLFVGNSGGFGGAIVHSGSTLTITNSRFYNNSARADGGALYLYSQLSRMTLQSCAFSGNVAKRGGAWFVLSTAASKMNVVGPIYSNNTPNNFASDLHNLKVAAAPLNYKPIASVRSGSALNVTIQLLARDAFNQPYLYGGKDRVPIVRVVPDKFNLTGELTKAIGTFSTNWTGLVAYGRVGSFVMTFLPTTPLATAAPFVIVSILQCDAPMQLDSATQLGPYYPVCAPVSCVQGCVHGTCTSTGQCKCDPGFEGIACEFPIDLSDTIDWTLASPPYLPTPSVRDALIRQAQAVLPPGHSPLFRSMVSLNGTDSTGTVRFRFAVVDANGRVVQTSDLSPVIAYIADAIRSWPRSRITSFYGFIWPPTVATPSRALAAATARTAGEPGSASLGQDEVTSAAGLELVEWVEPVQGNAVARTDTQSSSVWTTPAFQMSVATVPKVGVSEELNDGKILLSVFGTGYLVHLVSFLYLVMFQRQHRVVITSNPWWLLLVTLSVGAMHVWFILWTAAPSPTTCMAQLATGLVAGSTFIIAAATKALHSYLIHENAVAFHTLGMSAKTFCVPLVVFGTALTVVEAGIVCAWLLNPATTSTSALSISLTINSSYWHCTTAWVHPAAILYALVNGIVLLVSLAWIAYARHVPSPSHEPRMLAFAVANMVLMFAVMGGLIYLDVSVVQWYLITSAAAAVTVSLASFGLIGYKLVAIHWRTSSSTGVHTFTDKGRLSELVSPASHRPVLSTASRASGKAVVDLDLCVIDHTSMTASALAPVRVQSGGRLAPWRLCEVEIAKHYQYLTVLPVNGPATSTTTFYALPYRNIATDDKAWVVIVTFKSGGVLEIQARDADNLSEWKRALDVGPEKSWHARVRPSAKHAATAAGTTKGATSSPRKGAQKAASISRTSRGPGRARSEPDIGLREETE